MSILGMNVPLIDPKGIVTWKMAFFVLLMFVCPDLPVRFLEMIHKSRASLVFSRSVSRRAFLLTDLLGVFLYLCVFSAVSIITVGLALALKLQGVPPALISSLFHFPIFALLGYYVLSVLFILTSHSYSLALVGPILLGYLSMLLYYRQNILSYLAFDTETVRSIVTVIYLITPRTFELSLMTFGFLDTYTGNLMEVMASFTLPLLVLFGIIGRKEF